MRNVFSCFESVCPRLAQFALQRFSASDRQEHPIVLAGDTVRQKTKDSRTSFSWEDPVPRLNSRGSSTRERRKHSRARGTHYGLSTARKEWTQKCQRTAASASASLQLQRISSSPGRSFLGHVKHCRWSKKVPYFPHRSFPLPRYHLCWNLCCPKVSGFPQRFVLNLNDLSQPYFLKTIYRSFDRSHRCWLKARLKFDCL